MLHFGPDGLHELALLGAHCDDIAIGAGGTLLRLCRARPGMRISALVLTGGGTGRDREEKSALAKFCPGAQVRLTVLDLPDGRVPAHWDRAKTAVETLRAECDPDLVLAPSNHDAHQDHRSLAKLAPTVFRDHCVLGYEILKSDPDLAQPSTYSPLPEAVVAEKSALLHEHYPSQSGRDWFDQQTFFGLARIRGVQCRASYAEAFFADRLVVEFGTAAGAAPVTVPYPAHTPER